MEANIKLTEWPSRSPVLNPTEQLCTTLKSGVCARKATNLNEPYQYCKEKQSNIHPQLYQKVLDNYQKCPGQGAIC